MGAVEKFPIAHHHLIIILLHDNRTICIGSGPKQFLCKGKASIALHSNPPYVPAVRPPVVIDCQVLRQSAVVSCISTDIHIIKGKAGQDDHHGQERQPDPPPPVPILHKGVCIRQPLYHPAQYEVHGPKGRHQDNQVMGAGYDPVQSSHMACSA